MLSESLQVHGVPPHALSAQCGASTCSSGDGATTRRASSPVAAGQPTANGSNAACVVQDPPTVDAAAQKHHHAADLHHLSLMLQYSAPQTAAEIMAARAKSRRIRIQRQALYSQVSYVKMPLQPRPGSPPPVVLDGAMLLSSCPGAPDSGDVLFADLNACQISSIAMPQAEPHSNCSAAEAVGGATTAVAGSKVAEVTFTRLSSASSDGSRRGQDSEQMRPAEAGTDTAAAAVLATNANQAVAALVAASTAAGASQARAAAIEPQGPSLTEFRQLCSLCLSDNRLTCIAGLAWLPSLQQVNVSANRLRGLEGLAQVLGISATNNALDTQQQLKQRAETQQGTDSRRCSTHSSSRSCSSSSLKSHRASQQQQEDEQQQQHQQQPQQQHRISPQVSSAAVNPPWDMQQVPRCPGDFACLREIDLSFNLIPGDQLLGAQSPLARLPRLSTLHAIGNSLTTLPGVLGPFTCLSYLDMSDNKLRGAALLPLGQLPALQQLLLGNNPIRKAAEGLCELLHGSQTRCSSGMMTTGAPNSAEAGFSGITSGNDGEALARRAYKQLKHLDLSHTRIAATKHLLPLLQLPQLSVLRLVGTPLAARRCSGRDPFQELGKSGLSIITHEDVPHTIWLHSSQGQPLPEPRHYKQQSSTACGTGSSAGLLLPVTVEEATLPEHVLSAAGKRAVLGLRHEQLVAAFNRVEKGIATWQLSPVAEGYEGSEVWGDTQEAADNVHQSMQVVQQRQPVESLEPIVDETFLTGVGITAELPWHEEGPSSPQPAEHEFQDPTERLAIELGLQICQLAHYTHKQLNNPAAAVHKLRHALAHPLVDADVGQRPPQHHTSMTAAAAARQRPQQLLALPQPISTTLDTRVKSVQSIKQELSSMRNRLQVLQGSLLQQLQAQSDKLANTAQSMHSNAG